MPVSYRIIKLFEGLDLGHKNTPRYGNGYGNGYDNGVDIMSRLYLTLEDSMT